MVEKKASGGKCCMLVVILQEERAGEEGSTSFPKRREKLSRTCSLLPSGHGLGPPI